MRRSAPASCGRPEAAIAAFGVDDAFQFAQEPWVELARVVDVLDRQSGAQRLCGHQQPIGTRFGQCGAEGVGAAIAGRLDLVEARQAGLHAAQALLQRLGEAAADRHRLADRLHRCGQQGGVPGNFSNVKRGIFTTT